MIGSVIMTCCCTTLPSALCPDIGADCAPMCATMCLGASYSAPHPDSQQALGGVLAPVILCGVYALDLVVVVAVVALAIVVVVVVVMVIFEGYSWLRHSLRPGAIVVTQGRVLLLHGACDCIHNWRYTEGGRTLYSVS